MRRSRLTSTRLLRLQALPMRRVSDPPWWGCTACCARGCRTQTQLCARQTCWVLWMRGEAAMLSCSSRDTARLSCSGDQAGDPATDPSHTSGVLRSCVVGRLRSPAPQTASGFHRWWLGVEMGGVGEAEPRQHLGPRPTFHRGVRPWEGRCAGKGLSAAARQRGSSWPRQGWPWGSSWLPGCWHCSCASFQWIEPRHRLQVTACHPRTTRGRRRPWVRR
jgi:hypothetical protein